MTILRRFALLAAALALSACASHPKPAATTPDAPVATPVASNLTLAQRVESRTIEVLNADREQVLAVAANDTQRRQINTIYDARIVRIRAVAARMETAEVAPISGADQIAQIGAGALNEAIRDFDQSQTHALAQKLEARDRAAASTTRPSTQPSGKAFLENIKASLTVAKLTPDQQANVDRAFADFQRDFDALYDDFLHGKTPEPQFQAAGMQRTRKLMTDILALMDQRQQLTWGAVMADQFIFTPLRQSLGRINLSPQQVTKIDRAFADVQARFAAARTEFLADRIDQPALEGTIKQLFNDLFRDCRQTLTEAQWTQWGPMVDRMFSGVSPAPTGK